MRARTHTSAHITRIQCWSVPICTCQRVEFSSIDSDCVLARSIWASLISTLSATNLLSSESFRCSRRRRDAVRVDKPLSFLSLMDCSATDPSHAVSSAVDETVGETTSSVGGLLREPHTVHALHALWRRSQKASSFSSISTASSRARTASSWSAPEHLQR